MEGKRLIERLTLRSFLSYGSEGASLDLLPLNVLIGPNAAGKSNLIEALAVLRATPRDLAATLREGGGIREYIWKSEDEGERASIEVLAGGKDVFWEAKPLRYSLTLWELQDRLVVWKEEISHTRGIILGDYGVVPQVLYRLVGGSAFIEQRVTDEEGGEKKFVKRELRARDLVIDQSILSQRRDPDLYPELTDLADLFGGIAIFQDWMFGRRTRARTPQPADLPTDFLLPDGSNLALVLNELMQRSATRDKLIGYLRRFYESARHISVRILGGSVQLFIEESHGELVPAARLSDGTLRYLSLLTILLHPSPPPLVCIEEPELGLHPDILPILAELLVDASQRTQLVVTTHSDTLVSALSEVPECIVVCEPGPDGTRLRRLGDAESLAEWLNRYSLGEMWRMGEIGGNR